MLKDNNQNAEKTERWCIQEITLKGPSGGNPFVDVEVSASFRYKNRIVEADGFYDGEGIYKIRFMPDKAGEWRYEIKSNCEDLNGIAGGFTCTEASAGNHGPVRIFNSFHFVYEDGMRYYPVGTTCYAWVHQTRELMKQTVKTLADSPFNKVRMCVFPIYYRWNEDMPPNGDVFEFNDGDYSTGYDYTKPNIAFFRNLDEQIENLMNIGVEADLILFHPYDYKRWGYDQMGRENDELYLRYIVARFAAFRNVWWSFGNEFDLMEHKSLNDWDADFRFVQERDPYQHLMSMHNQKVFSHYTNPRLTFACIQSIEMARTSEFQSLYNKPVIMDECGYEGDCGNYTCSLTPEEMIHRFWEAYSRGGYAGHSDMYYHPENIMWWSRGGTIRGKSIPNIAFLREIFEDTPTEGIYPNTDVAGKYVGCAGWKDEFFIIYIGNYQMGFIELNLPEGSQYEVEVINAWEMTIMKIDRIYEGKCEVKLPAKPYVALRVRKI